MAWATTSDIKTTLGISGSSQDAQIADLIPKATAWIETQIMRTIESASYVEIHDGGGRDLILKHRPLTAVESVIVDSDRVWTDTDPEEAANYAILEGTGILRHDGWWPKTNQGTQVKYTGGYTTVPADLVLALAEVVQLGLNQIGKAGLSGETIGTYSYSLGDMSALPTFAQKTLANWRDGTVIR